MPNVDEKPGEHHSDTQRRGEDRGRRQTDSHHDSTNGEQGEHRQIVQRLAALQPSESFHERRVLSAESTLDLVDLSTKQVVVGDRRPICESRQVGSWSPPGPAIHGRRARP